MNAVDIRDLSFTYPSDDDWTYPPLFQNLNLQIEDGTFTAILGHNGCGKSTLAKQMNAIRLPCGGAVYVYGMNTADRELLFEIRKRCGMVFQNPDNQIVANVVEEDVAFAPENLGFPPKEIRDRVDDALRRVGMSEYREHAPHLLSGGQKQRVAIAGVLAMHPSCIVLDEPTAMLDPRGRRDVMDILHALHQEGITIVLITHHMREAAEAQRIVVMNKGDILCEGTPKEVFSQVELLRSVGLEVPDTVSLLYELRRAGEDIPLDAISLEECAELIIGRFCHKE